LGILVCDPKNDGKNTRTNKIGGLEEKKELFKGGGREGIKFSLRGRGKEKRGTLKRGGFFIKVKKRGAHHWTNGKIRKGRLKGGEKKK